MGSFLKQLCFPNDDEHRRIISYLKTIANLKKESESAIAYLAIKEYVEKEIKYRQVDLDGCEKIEQIRRETQEKIAAKQIIDPNALCKECGAVSTDARGFVVHSSGCSYFKSPEQIQRLVEWGKQQQAKAGESGRRSLI